MLELAVKAAAEVGRPARIHLIVNSGLNREGFDLEQLAEVIPALQAHIASGRIVLEGVMSKMDYDPNRWSPALGRFEAAIALLEANGLRAELVHLWSSNAMVAPADKLFSVVRIGTSLFGYDADFAEDPELWPMLEVCSRVAQVFEVEGVDGRRALRARVPAGYADLNFLGTGKALAVTIRGREYPVVSADRHAILVDLGSDSTVAEGDEVLVFGPGTLNDHANSGGGAGIFLGWGVSHEVISAG